MLALPAPAPVISYDRRVAKRRRFSAGEVYYIAFPMRLRATILADGYRASRRQHVPFATSQQAASAACSQHHPGETIEVVALRSLPEGVDVVNAKGGGFIRTLHIPADCFEVVRDESIQQDVALLQSSQCPVSDEAWPALARLADKASTCSIGELRLMETLGILCICERLLEHGDSSDFIKSWLILSCLRSISPAAACLIVVTIRKEILHLARRNLSTGTNSVPIHEISAHAQILSTLAADTLVSHQRSLDDAKMCPPPRINYLSFMQAVPSSFISRRYELGLERLKQKHAGGCTMPGWMKTIPQRMDQGARWNEAFLWHGCPHKNLRSILKSGLDPRLAGASHGNGFGSGLYFAKHFSKADFYAKPDVNNSKYMLLCLVSLGKAFEAKLYMQSLTLPPCAACGKEIRKSCKCEEADMSFDSVYGVPDSDGGCLNYPEFVVYSADQVVPVAMVEYCHETNCACAICCRVRKRSNLSTRRLAFDDNGS
eukprot:TRINITY_DN11740_c0_g1_i2.p1 TRINITY_DN11740_c0_g1~~TRINITY_DN11740_c0_g1_i2.p1  ORF type:complete len:517 (+),score=46.32 TRINITY_DN11740_c0_g1_i2:92-1552(+)